VNCVIEDSIFIIPHGMILVGTCAACNGPVLAPQIWRADEGGDRPLGQCQDCGKREKRKDVPRFGPIVEVK
jgi:NAD-dependent SIR2 family protein deacetylase